MSGNEYRIARWVFLRALGLVHLSAFASLCVQIAGLIGRRGILPIGPFLEAVRDKIGAAGYFEFPTVFWWGSSDAALEGVCIAGMVLSLVLVAGFFEVIALLALWALYLSLEVAGRTFLSFQWDILLTEVTFAAIWISHARPWVRELDAPPRSAVMLLRLIGFKLVFSSGVMKYRSGDVTWRNLTALDYHYETQPLPTWIGWFAHHLPEGFQKFSVLVMFFVQLVGPFLLFVPVRWMRLAGCGLLIGLQVLIALTGNYCFFNALAIALCCTAIDDRAWSRLLPRAVVEWLPAGPKYGNRAVAVVRGAAIGVLVVLNVLQLERTTLGRGELSERGEELLEIAGAYRTVGSYGLFAVMTTSRKEIVVEGSDDGEIWKAYEFEYKPGDLNRRPGFVEPHQPRLDWQMWFAALGSQRQSPWFQSFAGRLLEGSPEVLGLLQKNPFPDAPPKLIRAELYEYHFSSFGELWDEGRWWRREPAGIFLPPSSLGDRP